MDNNKPAPRRKPSESDADLVQRILEFQMLSEERMLAFCKTSQDQFLDAVKTMGKKERPIDITVETPPEVNPKFVNRQTDKFYAYCQASYIVFKEEPVAIDEGPGSNDR